MSNSSWLWLCLAAYAIHVLEEFVFDWESWARRVLNFLLAGQISTSPTASTRIVSSASVLFENP